jgi:hypothetical protein
VAPTATTASSATSSTSGAAKPRTSAPEKNGEGTIVDKAKSNDEPKKVAWDKIDIPGFGLTIRENFFRWLNNYNLASFNHGLTESERKKLFLQKMRADALQILRKLSEYGRCIPGRND